MNKTLKYALSAVLGLAVLTPAIAQHPFPGVVNPDHWAYKAVAELAEKKILVGYPSGYFLGPRSATRYEMAVAIWGAYNDLQETLKRIDDAMTRMGNMADMETMKAAIAQLQADMAKVQAWRSEIDDINRLMKEFQRELASLGVDVAATRKAVTDLEERVGILEKRKAAVDFSGDANFVGLGGYSQSGNFGLTVDGRVTGVDHVTGLPAGADEDLTILHEVAVTMTGTNDEGPKWGGTVVFGNMTGFGVFGGAPFGDQVNNFSGFRFGEGAQGYYMQDLWAMFDTSLAGLAFNAQVGRIGVSVSPYILMRPDNSPYFSNERWDNGRYTIDGANLGFNFGSAKMNVFGGRTGSATDSNFFVVQPMRAGRIGNPFNPIAGPRPVGQSATQFGNMDRMLGTNISLPLTQNGSLNLAYIWLREDAGAVATGNGVNVFGGDLRFNLGGPTLEAGYSQSDVVYNTSTVVNQDNAAWWAKLGWAQGKWGASVGYRQIEPQFAAPGSWGRIGLWWNPADIQGFMADAYFDLTDSVRFTASAEMYEGTGALAGGLTTDDNVNRYVAGLAYKLNGAWDLGLGYEHVEWDMATAGGNPVERWWNIGFGYTLSNSVGLKILWQISDYHNGSRAPFNVFGLGTYRGGLATAQFSVKF